MRKNLIALVSYSITNITTTLLLKLAGTVTVEEGGSDRSFFHPFMQTQIMILGEALCFIPYYFGAKKASTVSQSKLPSKITLSLLPLALDLSSSILIFVALNYLSASVYSLLAGQIIVFTAILSRIFLKSKISKAQIVGSILTIISTILAGIGESFGDQTSQQINQLILGIILVSIAIALQAAQAVVYEKNYNKYDISALQMVGYQGMIGTVFWTALLIFFKFIDCPFSQSQCVLDANGNAHLENFTTFFSEIGSNTYLLILNIVFLFVVARYNNDQSTVVVTANAFTLCIIRIFSNGLVWVIGIIITVVGSNLPEFDLQSLDLTVNGIKLAAFILSTIGMLIYYELFCREFFVPKIKEDQEEDLVSSMATVNS